MLTKLRLALMISAPLVAGATSYALAGDGPDRAAVIQKFDKNGDGKLDDAERAAMRDALTTERFQAMDKNGDGVLSLDEFKAGTAKAGLHRHGRHGKGKRHAGLKAPATSSKAPAGTTL